MNKKMLRKSFLFVLAASSILAVTSQPAMAWDNGGSRREGPRGGEYREGPRGGQHREVIIRERDRYSYHDGRFFRLGWFGFEFAIGIPPAGIIVSTVPARHRTLIVGGVTYYTYDNVYYRACPTGYVVVPAPAVSPNVVYVPAATTVAGAQVITINVPNSDGSFTPVTLTQNNGGYVGPQGEYYAIHPTVDQLRVLYGR